MFGYQKDELLRQKIELLIPKRYDHRHQKHRENFTKHPQPRFMGMGMDLYGRKKDNSEFPVEVSLSPFESPRGKYVIAFIIDITVRKQSEEVLLQQKVELEKVSNEIKILNTELERKVEDRTIMLRETLAQLEKSKDEIAESLKTEKELGDLKSIFVSTVSHEFRTPLSTILSSASLISKYGKPEDLDKRERHVAKIKESVKHMSSMLEDLLSLSKLEEGLITAKPETFHFGNFMTEFASELQEIAKPDQKILLEACDIGEITTDKRLIKNILLNLTSNAIKFSDEGSVITLACVNKKKYLRISVKDSGIGISKEDKEHLFERFFRARNAANIQGTGLGLHIISKYLELLNGKISLESELDVGSTFTIEIPLN